MAGSGDGNLSLRGLSNKLDSFEGRLCTLDVSLQGARQAIEGLTLQLKNKNKLADGLHQGRLGFERSTPTNNRTNLAGGLHQGGPGVGRRHPPSYHPPPYQSLLHQPPPPPQRYSYHPSTPRQQPHHRHHQFDYYDDYSPPRRVHHPPSIQPQPRRQPRFVATELASDIIVNVGDVKFYLHKFPLLSKSSRLQRLVTANNNENDEIQIDDIPGGAAAFEICAKFCYGMTVTLNPYNVITARCAAEYLEMHETTEKGNLIYKIEVFLSTSIFRSWKDSIIVLQSTKSLLPWAEDLKLVRHCIDSIACKASIDASKVDWCYTYNRKKLPSENRIDPNWNGVKKQQSVPKDWWVEDLCELQLDFYKCVIVAIKAKGKVSYKVMGEALKAYTYRRLPGFSKGIVIDRGDNMKSCSLLETVVRLLPEEKGSISCSFLTRLLKAAGLLDCSETCKRELVKRIGWQLEEASVSDLLLAAPPGEITVYDIDTVLSLLEEFVMQEKYGFNNSAKITEDLQEIAPALVSDGSKMAVAKLVDGYLSEISRDQNLPLSKFLDLAEMVSAESRPVHDGLYHAVDVYVLEHSGPAAFASSMVSDSIVSVSMARCFRISSFAALVVRTEEAKKVPFIGEVHSKQVHHIPSLPASVNFLSRSIVPFQSKKLDLAIYTFDDCKELEEPHQDQGRSHDEDCRATSARDSFSQDLNSRSSSFEERGKSTHDWLMDAHRPIDLVYQPITHRHQHVPDSCYRSKPLKRNDPKLFDPRGASLGGFISLDISL